MGHDTSGKVVVHILRGASRGSAQPDRHTARIPAQQCLLRCDELLLRLIDAGQECILTVVVPLHHAVALVSLDGRMRA